MKQIESTKLTVQLSQPGTEKLLKQNFANAVSDPDDASVIQLGQIIAGLAPEENDLDSVLETSVYSHNINE